MYCIDECFSDATEFLNAISLRGESFVTTGKYHWLFRGQPTRHRLQPRAWRPGGLATYVDGDEPKTLEEYARAEFRIAQDFFILADRRGLQLPEDTQLLRREIHGIDEVIWPFWPSEQHLSLLALAQHNGLPTRLLDWSWNPYVAAYFAAVEALSETAGEQEDELEVCALSTFVFSREILASQLGIRQDQGEIVLMTAPSAGNENLRAQEGAFTLWRPPESDPVPASFPPPPLDNLIGSFQGDGTHHTLLYRFGLIASEARFLLYLLQADGVSTSSIWPGYRGVADEVSLRLGPYSDSPAS